MPPVLTPASFPGGGGGGAVDSVDSRTGVVTLADLYDALGAADAKITQTITNGVTTTAPSEDALFDALALKAALASPALTGTPTAPTPAAADNDTSIATTAFVQGELAAKAPLASPALTGNPTAPTPSQGDNDTSLATTAYVQTEAGLLVPRVSANLAPLVLGVSSPSAVDDEFADGSIHGDWTQVTPGGAVTWSEGRGGLTGYVTSGTGNKLAVILRACSVAVGESVETRAEMIRRQDGNTTASVLLATGTANGSNIVGCGYYQAAASTITLWTFNGTITTYAQTATQGIVPFDPMHIRLRRSASTTYVPEFSIDGNVWTSFGMASLTDSNTFTHAGLAITNFNGSFLDGRTRFEFFRRTA